MFQSTFSRNLPYVSEFCYIPSDPGYVGLSYNPDRLVTIGKILNRGILFPSRWKIKDPSRFSPNDFVSNQLTQENLIDNIDRPSPRSIRTATMDIPEQSILFERPHDLGNNVNMILDIFHRTQKIVKIFGVLS